MDLLRELEAKKERLRLLKEKRQRVLQQDQEDNGVYSQNNNIEDKVANDDSTDTVQIVMIDASTQTDIAESKEFEIRSKAPLMTLPPIEVNVKSQTGVVMYDHGVQTDAILLSQYTNKEENSETKLVNAHGNANNTMKQPALTDEDSKSFNSLNLEPLIIKNIYDIPSSRNINDKVETFASSWYSKGGDTTEHVKIDKNSNVKHIHSYHVKNLNDSFKTIICQSIDYDSNRKVTLATFLITKDNSNEIPESQVYVIDTFKDTIIDHLEFLGQTVTSNQILRKFETQNIISMLLVTKRGKTILYELQNQNNVSKWDRNLLVKDYHLGCDYLSAIWENKFKLILADSKGQISILNSLDLSVDRSSVLGSKDVNIDNNQGDTSSFTNFKVIPPLSNLLYSTDEKTSEVQRFIDEYLSKIIIFNELNITSLVGSPFNDECLFLGTEDGGIYKILITDATDSRSIYLMLNNYGFLPTSRLIEGGSISPAVYLTKGDQLTIKTLFHQGSITNLSMEPNGLMLSSSIDWTIVLWDIKDNQKLDMIDLNKPVLDVKWVLNQSNGHPLQDKYICYAMTWDTIYIIQWFPMITTDSSRGQEQYFHKVKNAEIIAEIGITLQNESSTLNQFTSSHLIVEEVKNNNVQVMLITGGGAKIIDYWQLVIEPK